MVPNHRCHKTGRVFHCEQADCDKVNDCHECPELAALFAQFDEDRGGVEVVEELLSMSDDVTVAAWDATIGACPNAAADRCAGIRS